jgi:hypothetical protein
MSVSKETVVLIIVANLVLTSLVVAGAFLVYPPKAAETAPVDTAKLEETIASLQGRLAEAERRSEEQMLAFADRLSELEGAPRAAPPSGMPAIAEALISGGAKGPADPNDPARMLMEGFGKMIQVRARQQRDQYIQELKSPTEKSESRRRRDFSRIAQEAARNMDLDERGQAEVERILLQVDDRRREEFKALVDSKPTADDITFDEVKQVLDRSYEDEDRLVAGSFSPEQAEEYKKSAEPFRQMIYMGARSAFPEKAAASGDAGK